jgi:hypothetical protein
MCAITGEKSSALDRDCIQRLELLWLEKGVSTGMDMEQGRLEKLYGEMGDEHLLDMAEDADDLTDAGRLALAQELRRRGLTPKPPRVAGEIEPVEEPELESGFGPGIPGMFPGGATMMEQALDQGEITRDGMKSLISFYDGIELSKACRILEDDELEPVIEPIQGDATTGVPPRFEVWLQAEQIDRAKSLLRLKMGLFPVAEVNEDGDSEPPPTGLVGVFATVAEAEEVRLLLVEAGIAATVEHEEEYGEWEVMVDPEQQERAVAVVASGMGLGS